MATDVLRIALAVDSEYVAAWQHLMIERLQAAEGMVLTAVIFREPVKLPLSTRINQACLWLLRRVDGLLFSCPSTAQEPRSLLDLTGDITLCHTGGKRYWQLLAGQKVDVLIELTGQAVPPELAEWPGQGVWRHFYGNPAALHDRHVGLHEYCSASDEIISGIERLLPGCEEPEPVFCATTSMDPVSVSRGIEHTLWKMAEFMPQRLQELQQVGAENFRISIQQRHFLFKAESADAGNPLGIGTTLLITVKYLRNLMRKLYRQRLRREQWILLVGEDSGTDIAACTLSRFRKLIPPSDRFWADPCVVEHDGEYWVFFEELEYARGIGHLACMRMNEDGSHSGVIKVLEKPYHLSYPFVFDYQGQYYMVPETADNHTVELYRCEEFPHRWVFEKNLMEGVDAYDSTLLEHDGRWWLFASMRQHENCLTNEALYLFHADNPLSTDWQPHPQNPVVASASQARPAGRLFEKDGSLYRPSQNCAGAYGKGLNINLIRQFDRQIYREETVHRCQPEGECDLVGMHTLDSRGRLTVSDAVQIHWRPGVLHRWLAKAGI